MVYALQHTNNTRKLLIRYAANSSPHSATDLLEDSGATSDPEVIKCDVENIPYNTFFHLAVVVYGHTIVVYINGILVKTRTFSSKLAILHKNDKITNTYDEHKSFIGWISKLRYFVDISKETGGALTDKQVYDLYLNGPYPSLFTRMLQSISERFISFADGTGAELQKSVAGSITSVINEVDEVRDIKKQLEKAKHSLKTNRENNANAAHAANGWGVREGPRGGGEQSVGRGEADGGSSDGVVVVEPDSLTIQERLEAAEYDALAKGPSMWHEDPKLWGSLNDPHNYNLDQSTIKEAGEQTSKRASRPRGARAAVKQK